MKAKIRKKVWFVKFYIEQARRKWKKKRGDRAVRGGLRKFTGEEARHSPEPYSMLGVGGW